MKRLAIYRVSDGQVLRFCTVNKIAGHAGEGEDAVLLTSEAPEEAAANYQVISGMLTAKPILSLAVDKPQILADGIDQATVTFTGILSTVHIAIGGVGAMDIPAADPTLRITSDVPRRFRISVEDPAYQRTEITLEAR